MIVDTSVLAAIVFGEPERARFLEILATADTVKISAATVTEASIVVHLRFGAEYVPKLHRLLADIGCIEIPLTGEHRALAEEGHARYGKGRREPPAALNFGDCFSYALAKATGEPLLFKSDDFSRTDLAWIDIETGNTVRATGATDRS